MTDQEAMAAIAVVDRLRLEAARTAMALEGLEAVMVDRGASQGVIGRVLGVPQSVRRWCAEQAQILMTGTPEQQAIFHELGPVPVGHDGGETMRLDKARMGVLPAVDTIEAADRAIEAH